MYLENPNTVLHSEFYPGLTTSPEEYIENYLKSKASVLLMAGPAGTGKTTLLRHMIYKHNMCASVVYDENLMMSDSVFQTFLFDRENDVLIIEDADLIITSRQDDNNKLMSRFLNISDGLIKLPNKKLIFTTNISDFGRVDSALMRPGRCFDVMHTRHLSYEEAKKAAKVAGVTVPTEEREYTLAEVFSQKKWQEKRRVGFGFAA
jgi:SpoVK/Ycf46/Vps4 family AAA+-type ATPase